jgi:hypothetical protein
MLITYCWLLILACLMQRFHCFECLPALEWWWTDWHWPPVLRSGVEGTDSPGPPRPVVAYATWHSLAPIPSKSLSVPPAWLRWVTCHQRTSVLLDWPGQLGNIGNFFRPILQMFFVQLHLSPCLLCWISVWREGPWLVLGGRWFHSGAS